MQTDGTIPSGANLFRFPRCNRNSTPPLNINYAIRSTKNVFFRFLPLDPSFVSVFQIILSPAFPFAPIFPFFPPFTRLIHFFYVSLILRKHFLSLLLLFVVRLGLFTLPVAATYIRLVTHFYPTSTSLDD